MQFKISLPELLKYNSQMLDMNFLGGGTAKNVIQINQKEGPYLETENFVKSKTCNMEIEPSSLVGGYKNSSPCAQSI